MSGKQRSTRLTPSMPPSEPNFDVKDSSFFSKWDNLPSPEEVYEQAKAKHLAGANLDNRRRVYEKGRNARPSPVVFEDLGLLVKWGSEMNISEAQSLYAIARSLKGGIPVPEVYGWRTEGEETFIYMEHIKGQTLEQVWDTMEPEDRISVSHELRAALDNLRQLEQDPSDPFIGNVVRGPLYDRVFHIEYMSEAGPFPTVRAFHDWWTFLHRRRMSDPHSVPIEPFRYGLPDDSSIKFTHGDLHPSNIILTSSYPYRVLAVIDWEQSGWLPEYWETRKARLTHNRSEGWSSRYLPMIMDQYTSTWDPWDYYIMSMGC
ncbi:hypothetical protein ASPWEDRAFT_134828 [Aspergillus wentii DTO 134E9]|uniref:Aminoglycoside phosphotransferase domain-containing protein n=1 Tax=Aspergillus wentii DTO 134E9 TaxID=1073089 RepID=A0A1L9RMT8_ASPWE|nr:uncharacterized protein ASPWEDRAFT_134828 [Aspergillus wentii DTO 134E9]OJJ36138.1 hypothetical protein ASPWEDRAFT_134828 [Aspergillus wentii DTO 134E9]